MGNTSSSIDPSHIRIYKNILAIKDPYTRVQMIQTVLAGPEYVASAKKHGVYSHLLGFVGKVLNNQMPTALPYEQTPVSSKSIVSVVSNKDYLAKPKSDEKAIGYFQACLQVLGLEEEVALTEDSLKSAYKKTALKTHPDKGGSEKAFERVTRAYAYLSEIIRRIHGGRKESKAVDAPTVLKDSRSKDSDAWKHTEPVKLNPKKLDLDAFNKVFNETRIPDPEEDGYGDWLKDAKDGSTAPTFSGKFNRDVFNQMFESESKKQGHNFIVAQPQSMVMAPSLGVELGRGKADSFTAAINSGLKFTDLKQAYTTETNLSQQVSHVRVDSRNFESYKNDREVPKPLTNQELEHIQESELYLQKKEDERRLRAAQQDVHANDYFERMKRRVITDASPIKGHRK
jgi:curved DNA-binding protein CbpA